MHQSLSNGCYSTIVTVIIIYYAAIKKYTIIVQYFAMTFNHDYHA